MKIIKDNIWSYLDKNIILIIPINLVVKLNGELVMGAGLALQAKNRYPGVAKDFGKEISIDNKIRPRFNTGNGWLFGFPTKVHYKDDSNYTLVTTALQEIQKLAEKGYEHNFYVPLLGSGCGKLNYGDMLKLHIKYLLAPNITLVLNNV